MSDPNEKHNEDVEWRTCDTSAHSDSSPKLDETQYSPSRSLGASLSALSCTAEAPQELSGMPSCDDSQRNELDELSQVDIPTKLNGRFLDVGTLTDLLEHTETVQSSIPKGVKEDIYFLVDNQHNLSKRMHGRQSNFDDDCGTWATKSSSTKKTMFYHNDEQFKSVELKNGMYCTRKSGEWKPMQPQPG